MNATKNNPNAARGVMTYWTATGRQRIIYAPLEYLFARLFTIKREARVYRMVSAEGEYPIREDVECGGCTRNEHGVRPAWNVWHETGSPC